jgi:hypothetical protein
LQASFKDFLNASKGTEPLESSFAAFVAAAEAWTNQHGYQNRWSWPGLEDALHRLRSTDIDNVPRVNICIFTCPPGAKPSGPKDVETYFAEQEDFTTRLIAAMKKQLASMSN